MNLQKPSKHLKEQRSKKAVIQSKQTEARKVFICSPCFFKCGLNKQKINAELLYYSLKIFFFAKLLFLNEEAAKPMKPSKTLMGQKLEVHKLLGFHISLELNSMTFINCTCIFIA